MKSLKNEVGREPRNTSNHDIGREVSHRVFNFGYDQLFISVNFDAKYEQARKAVNLQVRYEINSR